jgi:uncharacterized membrane protein YhaH (DUF805 family)
MANLQRLLRIAFSLAFNPVRIVEDAVGAVRRTAIFIVCALVAALILLPAIGCAAAGLWIYVQHQLGPVWAAFITAAAFVVLAVIILLVGVSISKRRAPDKARSEPSRQIDALTAAVPAALAALAEPKRVAAAGHGFFNRHKGTALLTAVVLGLVMGQGVLRPGLRK